MNLRICGLFLIAAGMLSAANFSGKWVLGSGAGAAPGRGGATILNLFQVGNQVTGVISVRATGGSNSPVNDEVWGGKVEGDTLSFYVWTGSDQPAKTTYTGKMSPSGDEIVFTVAGGRGAGSFGAGMPQAGGAAQGGRGGQAPVGAAAGGPAQAPANAAPAIGGAGRGQSGPQQITATRTM
jgi:hypothetical protein